MIKFYGSGPLSSRSDPPPNFYLISRLSDLSKVGQVFPLFIICSFPNHRPSLCWRECATTIQEEGSHDTSDHRQTRLRQGAPLAVDCRAVRDRIASADIGHRPNPGGAGSAHESAAYLQGLVRQGQSFLVQVVSRPRT